MAEREKEKEQNVYLDGIKQIVHTIQMQINTSGTEVKRDTTYPTPQASTVNKPRLLTKPAKVPTLYLISDFGDILQTITDLVGHLGGDS